MKWLKLPSGAEKPSWAGLWGTVSMAYLFVDVYQRGGTWTEWLWTGIAFVVFLMLCTLSAVYWARPRIMQQVCVAIAVLGIAFTLYRPTGVFFFIFVAAFGPLAASGRIAGSASIIIGAIVLIVGGWKLLWPPSMMPYVAAIEAFLVGGAIIFVVRQQIAVRRIVKTDERERIARDLHDILGHTLSVIILKSELASRLMEQNPARAKTEIEDVERISRQALADVREAISGYRTGDLQTELDKACAILETAGLVVERHYETTDMPDTYERVLALVLREAVTNVLRHAHATHCRISLQKTDSTYVLKIRDDGRGGINKEGNGMSGIRERIISIGGSVSWQSESGTELTITVPATTENKAK